uniref:Glycerol-3-phosphate acyltransferase, chloroplastic n=1 Tax=Rhizophora mucronata TaxID=61149 RepID=A0A2P2J9G3_RHIMU
MFLTSTGSSTVPSTFISSSTRTSSFLRSASPSQSSLSLLSLRVSSSASSASSSLPFLLFSSSSSSPSSSASCAAAAAATRGFRSRVQRSITCPCVLASLNVNAMADLVKNEMQDPAESRKESHPCTFLDATTEEELLSGIQNEAEAGRLPPNVAAGMEELYHTYKNAVLQSGIPDAKEVVLSNMAAALDRIFLDVVDPFVFEPYHKALREPFDYYNFGQNYIRPLIDFKNSFVGNIFIFNEIEEKLQQGHNVVLMSNHQTEADPAVIALLLEKSNPNLAENLVYVAGDRVLTDPLCKPFSIGRNLICVYSKKHMFDVPKLTEMKKKANIRSLKEMASLLRNGSQIVWIAPSGGRDRPDSMTGEWVPAHFDSSSVDNMRRLVEHSGAPGHIFPLALFCYDIMPPPEQVEKEIGEKRVVSFNGTGLSVAPEVSFTEVAGACGNPEEVGHYKYSGHTCLRVISNFYYLC